MPVRAARRVHAAAIASAVPGLTRRRAQGTKVRKGRFTVDESSDGDSVRTPCRLRSLLGPEQRPVGLRRVLRKLRESSLSSASATHASARLDGATGSLLRESAISQSP